jgi:hypothetical protein
MGIPNKNSRAAISLVTHLLVEFDLYTRSREGVVVPGGAAAEGLLLLLEVKVGRPEFRFGTFVAVVIASICSCSGTGTGGVAEATAHVVFEVELLVVVIGSLVGSGLVDSMLSTSLLLSCASAEQPSAPEDDEHVALFIFQQPKNTWSSCCAKRYLLVCLLL